MPVRSGFFLYDCELHTGSKYTLVKKESYAYRVINKWGIPEYLCNYLIELLFSRLIFSMTSLCVLMMVPVSWMNGNGDQNLIPSVILVDSYRPGMNLQEELSEQD